MRIRLGDSWKHNPTWLRALKALGDGLSKGFSPREIVDVLCIEIDGVDLAQGRAEASLLETMAGLLRAARAAAVSDGVHTAPLTHAPFEVRLERSGPALHLTLWSAETDSPVVGEVGVEPTAFLRAVQEAAKRLIEDLVSIHPALASQRLVRDLSMELETRPSRRRRVAAPASRRNTRKAGTPAFALSQSASMGPLELGLREGRAAVMVIDGRHRALWTRPGAPEKTLLSLALACSDSTPPPDVEIDRRLRTVRFGRGEPVPLATLKEALSTLAATLPEEAGRPIADALLVAPTAEEPHPLAHPSTRVRQPRAPRAPGLPADGLRRLSLRPAWKINAPGTSPTLARCQGGLLLSTASGTELRTATGELLWGQAVENAIAVGAMGESFVVGRGKQGALVVVDATTGETVAQAEASLQSRIRHAFFLPGGWVAAHDGAHLVALQPHASQSAWSFDTGRTSRIVATAAWAGIVVGTDRGELVALDASGSVAWRSDPEMAPVEHLTVDEAKGVVVATGLDAEGRVALSAFELENGKKLYSSTMDGARPTQPRASKGKLYLGYNSSRAGVLTALSLRTGRRLWQVHLPGEGNVSPFLAGDAVAVPRSGGGLALYEPSGTLRWHGSDLDPDPSLSPVSPRAPVFGAHLAVVPSAYVHVLESSSGRSVAELEPAELAPQAVCLLDGPVIVAAGHDGTVEAWRATGHLSVVR